MITFWGITIIGSAMSAPAAGVDDVELWCHTKAKYPDLIVDGPTGTCQGLPLVPQLWPKESAVVYKLLLLHTEKRGDEHMASWNGLVRSWWLWLLLGLWHTRHMCISDVSVCQWLRGGAMQVRVEVQGVSVDISVCFLRTWCRGVSWDSCASFGFCGTISVVIMGVL